MTTLTLLAIAPGGARADMVFRPFVGGSFARIVKAHAGHPTIIHFWGLTCGPCRVEMATWGRILAERHDFDFVTIDTDLVPAPPAQIEAFLSKAGIPARNEAWRFADSFAEKLYFQVDPDWQGEIPMTVLVGRDGHVDRIVGALETKPLEQWLRQQAATEGRQD